MKMVGRTQPFYAVMTSDIKTNYQSVVLFCFQGNGQTLRLSPPLLLFLSPLAEQSVSVEMLPRRFVDDQSGGPITRDDLMLVLADLTSLLVRVHLNASAGGPIR